MHSAQLVSVGDDYYNEANQASTAIITCQEYRVLVGNRKWIREKNFIEIPPEIEEKMLSQEKLGHTALLVAIDGNAMPLLSYSLYQCRAITLMRCSSL